MKFVLTCLIFSLALGQSQGQSTKEVNQQAIADNARRQLVAMSAPDGELSAFAVKNNIKGDFVVDLTIVGKGKIATVFMVSSKTESVQVQNQLKSKLMDIQFEDIKIPKSERIKFRHTLTF